MEEKKKLERKSLYLFKICSVLMTEELDNIAETTAYKQNTKSLVQKLEKALEYHYNDTFVKLDNDPNHGDNLIKSFFYVGNVIETFAKSVADSKDPDEMEYFIEGVKELINKNPFVNHKIDPDFDNPQHIKEKL